MLFPEIAKFSFRQSHKLMMEFRAAPYQYRIDDRQAGIVTAYVNQMEIVDDYASVFVDGVWDRAIRKYAPKMPRVLVDHEGRVAGKVLETRQERTAKGLLQRAQLQYNLKTQYGADAFSDVQDSFYDEFSVGFRTEKQHMEKRDGASVTIKDAVRWYEVSQVMAGASPGTGVIDIRSELEMLDLPTLTAEVVEYGVRAAANADAPKSPPKGYPIDRSQYADGTNYFMPLDTDARVHSAVSYYNAGAGKGGYSDSEWSGIGRKIIAAANTAFGGGYTLEGHTIVTPNTRALSGVLATASEASFVLDVRAGAAISAATRNTLQSAHDALASLSGVTCDPGNLGGEEAPMSGAEGYQAKTLQEYRDRAAELGIELKG